MAKKKQSMWKKVGIGALMVASVLGVMFGVWCLMALLIMLVWNNIIVTMLTITVALAFWKALALVAGIWIIVFVTKIIKAYIDTNIQRWQMQKSMENMKKFMQGMGAQEIKPNEPPDLMRHFKGF